MTPRPATRRERQTLSPSSRAVNDDLIRPGAMGQDAGRIVGEPEDTPCTEAFDPQPLGLLIGGVFARFAHDERQRLASVTAMRRSSTAFL